MVRARRDISTKISTSLVGVGVIIMSIVVFIAVLDVVVILVRAVMG